jgi:hypothetical protein
MSSTKSTNTRQPLTTGMVMLTALLGVLLCCGEAPCEMYGLRDAQGAFVPKLSVKFGDKEVTIKKADAQEKFRSLSLKLNPKNTNLIKNVAHLSVEWLDAADKPGKPVLFQGPKYDPEKRVFQESMIRSAALRILDKSRANLFARKNVPELFTISVDDQVLVSSESAIESDRTVQLGAGRDVSINVDRTSIVFNESNFKKGEILNVDNRSGFDQTLGLQVPDKGFNYIGVVRRPEQTKIPTENWEKFTLASNSGISIFLIPDPESAQVAQLDGKEIVLKVFQGTKIRETRKIPIKLGSDLKAGGVDLGPRESPGEEEGPATTKPAAAPGRADLRSENASPRPQQASAAAGAGRKPDPGNWVWLWILQIFNLVLLLALGAYGIFFMLPRIQVLEDRLAKSEMFLHGTREAIREELEQIKTDLLQQYPGDSSPK